MQHKDYLFSFNISLGTSKTAGGMGCVLSCKGTLMNRKSNVKTEASHSVEAR